MTYGLIISAGNQTRFDSDLPKALSMIGDKCILDINLDVMSKYCDKCFVVVSTDNYEYFSKYPTIVIKSGHGCGDAVLKALFCLPLNEDDRVIIQWGDCLHTYEVYERMLSNYTDDKVLIPCVQESKPYVQLLDGKVLFSKYGEQTSCGFHDLSIFYSNALLLQHSLFNMFTRIFNICSMIHDNYIYCKHRHNNEFLFLDVFNDTDLEYVILNMGDYADNSFNTIEQLENISAGGG